MKRKTAAIAGGSFFFAASVALLLSFSAIAAAATITPSMCERFPSLAERFPSCRDNTPPPPPPPADLCPNVPGNQTSSPCADSQCVDQGGTWDGDSCTLPPPPPPPSGGDDGRRNECVRYLQSPRNTPPTSCDICPNVSGVQLTGLCADTTCVDDGGTWVENACVMPPPDVCPNVLGDQASGPCSDDECADDGGTWNGESCDMPFVQVIYPNGGESFIAGEVIEITWDARDVGTCSLTSTPAPGYLTYTLIAEKIEGMSRSYPWIVTGGPFELPPQTAFIHIACTSLVGNAVEDYSDGRFSVVPSPECSDGLDNNSDEKIDYPADPGCSNANDDDESSSGGSAGGGASSGSGSRPSS